MDMAKILFFEFNFSYTVPPNFSGRQQEKEEISQLNLSPFHGDFSPCFYAKTIIVTWILGKIILIFFFSGKKRILWRNRDYCNMKF